ncbi:putative ribonuclease H-like domain-containing protein [Tanacetum coccineum]
MKSSHQQMIDEYAIRKKIIESKTTEPKDDTSESKTSETVGKTNEVEKSKTKINRDEFIIKDWNSNDKDDVSEVNTTSPVKTNETQTVKTQVDKIGQISQKEGIGFKKIKACLSGHLPQKIAQTGSAIRTIHPRMDNGNPKSILQYHTVVDSSCSSHMTGNKAYLSDYDDYNRGFVAFGSDPKGGKITGKGKNRTANLDFDDVYFVDELNFKLLDESQVVLRALGQNVCKFGFKRTLLLLRTKRLEENMHIDFLEDQPNVTGSGPNWMFDLDFLTNTMNYIPVSVENQVNVDAGSQEHYVAGSSKKDKEPTQEYILLLLHPHRLRISVEDVVQAAQEKPSEDFPKDNDVQDSEDVAEKEEQHMLTEADQTLKDDLERMIAIGKTAAKSLWPFVSIPMDHHLSILGTNTIDASTTPHGMYLLNPNMPDLEYDSNVFPNDGIFTGAYDDDDVGAEANFNNIDHTINVSPIPTLRIHKVHLKDQILGDPKSAVQTRGKIQKASSVQQALVSYIHKQNITNHKDYQNSLLACFLSQEEPKNISHALQDESWVEAMQEELLQFKLQKVWILVDLPFGKKEEGINYDEVFAPVARIEAIRLFLAFASFMGFPIYQIDVKSVFLYGSIEEEVYVHQPPGFVDPAHPNKVYKVIKALYGLHQAPRAADILKKFDFCSIKPTTTPIESNKPLVKDKDGVDVDVHIYRSMIGSLMYLIASRPDIMFDVCACARFQVTPKASHLNAVKRIFRYLKHQPKLGLWYHRDSPFELEAFSDSDYGGASLDRKSTTGGCQFLGRRLISWQCKKQTIVANSTTEAEYVAAANCCGQVLWIQNQMMDYGFNFMNTKIQIDNESTICIVKNPVYHSRTKHIEIRHHFIRDCYEKRLIDVVKIHTDNNVADLLTKGFDVTRFNFLVVSIGMLNL